MFRVKLSEANLVSNLRLQLGEGPCWNERRKSYFFVDIRNGSIYEHSNSDATLIHEIPLASSVCFTVDDQMVVTAGHQVLLVDVGGIHPLAFLDVEYPSNRCNDAKIGPDGQLWVGTMDDQVIHISGSLYQIKMNGEVTKLIKGIGISNTLAWDIKRNRFYFADSKRQELRYFSMNAISESFEDGRIFFQDNLSNDTPDGSCIDADGFIWNARWGSGSVYRISPDGQIVGQIEVPTSHVTSCCFGGEALNELLITTARDGLSIEQLASQPLAGGVFRVKLPFVGLHAYRLESI